MATVVNMDRTISNMEETGRGMGMEVMAAVTEEVMAEEIGEVEGDTAGVIEKVMEGVKEATVTVGAAVTK